MMTTLAMLSEWHIILALIIVFLLFGGRKLPELARGIGEALKEFKKSQRDILSSDKPGPAPAPAPDTTLPPVTPKPMSTVTTQTAPAGSPEKPAESKPG